MKELITALKVQHSNLAGVLDDISAIGGALADDDLEASLAARECAGDLDALPGGGERHLRRDRLTSRQRARPAAMYPCPLFVRVRSGVRFRSSAVCRAQIEPGVSSSSLSFLESVFS